MKKDKKGFTLIELVAVLVIISILALVATVSIMNAIKKSSDNAYKTIEETMKTAAKNYVLKTSNTGIITAQTLIDNSFMDTPIDPKSKKACYIKKSYVNVTGDDSPVSDTNNYKYNYTACLICGENGSNYMSDDCSGIGEIQAEYRYYMIENDYKNIEDTPIELSLENSIDVKYDIKAISDEKDVLELKKLANLKYKLNDDNCKEYLDIKNISDNSFKLFLKENIPDNQSCKLEIYDDCDEVLVEPKIFEITSKESSSNSDDNKYTVELQQLINSKYTPISYIEPKKLSTTYLHVEITKDGPNIDNLKYELDNNNKGCFALVEDSYNKTYFKLEQKSDECDNVQLAVYDGENKIKAYHVSVPEIIYPETMYISDNKVEIDGKSSKSIDIITDPEDNDMKNKIKCEPIGTASYYATCTPTGTNLNFKSIKPTPLGEYAYFKVYIDDNSEKNDINPITIRVKVNNVVPTSVQIKYYGGTQNCNINNYCYFCSSSNENYPYFTLTPSNAFYSSYRWIIPNNGLYNDNYEGITSNKDKYGNDYITIGQYKGGTKLMELNLKVYNNYNGSNVIIVQQSNPVVYTQKTKDKRVCSGSILKGTYTCTTITYTCCY